MSGTKFTRTGEPAIRSKFQYYLCTVFTYEILFEHLDPIAGSSFLLNVVPIIYKYQKIMGSGSQELKTTWIT